MSSVPAWCAIRIPSAVREAFSSRRPWCNPATNPVYLGWWLVEGRLVHTDNHSAIIAEDTFGLTQQVLTDHGRRPTSRGGVRSADPQRWSGLRWCTRHEGPRRMTAARVGPGGRYLCDDSYVHGQTDHCCTLLDARILDEPITDIVLRQCQFIEHAEAMLAQLDTEYDTVRDDARRRQQGGANCSMRLRRYSRTSP
jgi:hypothetical protein